MWLSTVPIGIGTGESEGASYRELRRILLPRTTVNRARRERAGVLGSGPYDVVGLRSPKTLVVGVQLPPYGSIGVGVVVDVDVVAGGVIP